MLTLTVDRHHIPGDYPQEKLAHFSSDIRAIIYARVSTQDQARHGYSLESQTERAADLAKQKFHIEREQLLAVIEQGEMGDDPSRPGLNQALWFIEHGIGAKFIVLHPDRLARDLKLQLYITERIWNAGCDIAFVEMDVDRNNPESLLLYNIQGAIAQYNKAKILANSKRGRRTKVQNGKIPGLRRLYGYEFDKALDTLVENPVEKQVYLTMVDWVLHGRAGQRMTPSAIARELSLLGVEAPSGGKWYQTTVSRILRNPVYTGKFYYGKTEVQQQGGQKQIIQRPEATWQEVPIPAYIDDSTFQTLQRRLGISRQTGRGRKPKRTYLLKGLIRCGRCGRAVVAGPPSRNKKTGEAVYHYYVCSAKSRQVYEVGTGRPTHRCLGRNWRQDVVDCLVWNLVKKTLLDSDDIVTRLIEGARETPHGALADASRVSHLERNLREKERERRRWLEHSVQNRISDAELDEALERIDEEMKRLQEALATASKSMPLLSSSEAELSLRQRIEAFHAYLDENITDAEKQVLTQALVQSVVVKENSIEVYLTWEEYSQNSDHRQEHGGLP